MWRHFSSKNHRHHRCCKHMRFVGSLQTGVRKSSTQRFALDETVFRILINGWWCLVLLIFSVSNGVWRLFIFMDVRSTYSASFSKVSTTRVQCSATDPPLGTSALSIEMMTSHSSVMILLLLFLVCSGVCVSRCSSWRILETEVTRNRSTSLAQVLCCKNPGQLLITIFSSIQSQFLLFSVGGWQHHVFL